MFNFNTFFLQKILMTDSFCTTINKKTRTQVQATGSMYWFDSRYGFGYSPNVTSRHFVLQRKLFTLTHFTFFSKKNLIQTHLKKNFFERF